MKRLSLLVATVATAVLIPAPVASADAGCVHRGREHAKQHGGQAADDAFHISHGELPSCSADDQEKKDDSADLRPSESVPDNPKWRKSFGGSDSGKKHDHHDKHRWWRND